jgi:uncharacterized protein YprB with RNaseH-like and TPR domain
VCVCVANKVTHFLMHIVVFVCCDVLLSYSDLKLQEEEVEAVEIWSIEKIYQLSRSGAVNVTPDGMAALDLYVQYLKDKKDKAAADTTS